MVRISDAGDEFLIVYFYNGPGLETGVIWIIKETFETYNQVLISR